MVEISKSNIPISEGRLQRASQNQEAYISKFRQVLLRHGLTMSLICFGCVLFPSVLVALLSSIDNLFLNINRYALASLGLGLFMFLYLRFTSRKINYRQIFWIGYLFLISIVEEIGFRLSLPILFSEFFFKEYSFLIGIVLSNLLFASLHYFTLRWKLKACIFTFLGGIGLSRLLYETGDITLVVMVHLVVTFLNTPSAPEQVNTEYQKNLS
ncbi:CPBP family intramembrane metalloprotease [SAR86 cluster bacterium]|nr:CPBP family intramembrane metalloprotease [SAR86 cluster bacterium]